MIINIDNPQNSTKYFDFDRAFGTDLNLEIVATQSSDIFLGFGLRFDFSRKLQEDLTYLLNKIPNHAYENGNQNRLDIFWWDNNKPIFIRILRNIMIQNCDVGYDWQFSKRQMKLIYLYCKCNIFFVKLLNLNNSYSSVRLKEEIEELLLLPIAEIEKRKQSDY